MLKVFTYPGTLNTSHLAHTNVSFYCVNFMAKFGHLAYTCCTEGMVLFVAIHEKDMSVEWDAAHSGNAWISRNGVPLFPCSLITLSTPNL